MNREKKIHRVLAGAPPPVTVPRRGTLALRKSRLVRRRIRAIFFVIGFTLSAAAITHASYGFLMETPYFQIRQIKIEGVSPPLEEEIKGLVDNMTLGRLNILGLDIVELEDQIARHPRIRDLRLDKIYPDQLLVRAVERQEVAVLATEKGMFLADDECHVMEKLEAEELAKNALPYISGLRSEEVHAGEPVKNASLDKALTLLQVLKERNTDLYNRISEIEILRDDVSPLESLTAHMKGGLDVRFGDSNPVEKLPALETVLRKFNNENIKPFDDLVFIDLRFANRSYSMDRNTALDVARDPTGYDEFERAVEAETEKYQKAHPKDDKEESASNSNSKSSTRKASSAPTSRKSSGQAAPRSAQQSAQQAQQYYGSQNYQQNAQQYYQQQYYQQRGYAPTQQNYRPANQQRY